MTDNKPYFDEVISAHIAIQQWFSSPADAAVLEELMARFSPRFTMVVPSGAQLDLDAVRRLFAKAGGGKPGLEIVVDQLTLLDQHAGGATVAYREAQYLGGQPSNLRLATVVFERDAAGALRWRHLQETFAPLERNVAGAGRVSRRAPGCAPAARSRKTPAGRGGGCRRSAAGCHRFAIWL